MAYNMRLVDNGDGTFDVLVTMKGGDTEFGMDFFSVETLKTGYGAVRDFVEKHAKGLRVNAVKFVVAGLVVASLALPTASAAASPTQYNMAYVYGGTVNEQIQAVNRTGDALNTVSPSYYDINAQGTLVINPISATLVQTMHQKGIKVTPFVSNHWDRQAGALALENFEGMAQQLVQSVVDNDLDGLNIDIENVTQLQRAQYSAFVARLRELLPQSKQLSVAVAANPTGTNVGWQGSYDYAALAANSDYLMIMTYDESYDGGPQGPVASIGFVERSIQYALSKGVPKDKIVVGVPFYGRMWSNDGRFVGNGVTLNKIDSLIATYGATVTYDKVAQSPKATFSVPLGGTTTTVNGKTLAAGEYVVWYENEQSLAQKSALVKQYDLKGMGTWALGNEPGSLWQSSALWNKDVGVTPTPAPTPEVVAGQTGKVAVAVALNMRSGPSTRYAIITSLPNGQSFTLIERMVNGWLHIRLPNGQTGYISGTYAVMDAAAPVAPTPVPIPVTPPPPPVTPVPEPPAAPPAVPVDPFSVGVIGSCTIKANAVVRSGAGSSFKRIGTVVKGRGYGIYEQKNGYSRLQYGNVFGWVPTSSILYTPFAGATPVNPAPVPAATGTLITTTNVVLRAGNSTKTKSLGTIKKGTVVQVLQREGSYTKVVANGKTGYLYTKYLK